MNWHVLIPITMMAVVIGLLAWAWVRILDKSKCN